MADSILALIVISLGVTTMITCQTALNHRQHCIEQRLIAARLAKEASDGYRLYHRPVTVARLGYSATAAGSTVLVYSHGKAIMRIEK